VGVPTGFRVCVPTGIRVGGGSACIATVGELS